VLVRQHAAIPSPPESTVRDEDRVGGGWGAPLHLIERMRERPKKRTEMPADGSRCVYAVIERQAPA
jgi:hypothetical protein